MNELARSITKWTKACDKRLNRLISYIHHTCEYKQYCHVGNTAKQCRLGLFQDSDFAGDLEDSKSTSGGTLCIFGSHTFVPISWMCKKQTSVSHSSTESEIISLDAGLRFDGIPALFLWDLIVSVFGNTIQTPERPERPVVNDKDQSAQGMTNVLNHIDCVPSNVHFSHQKALLCVFEDNEAVIKMIIEGRSPTMRHVSIGCSIESTWTQKSKSSTSTPKTNLPISQPKEISHVTNWKHLLCLFNIRHFSSTVCSETMAKRLQQDSGEERVTAKSRPMVSLIARVPSNVSSSTSVSPGKRSHGHQNPWSTIAEKEERPGRPDVGSDRKIAFDYYYHEQFIESFSSASYSKWDDGHACSSQEWKTDTEMCERSGRPDVISWGATRESQPGFSHEETQYGWEKVSDWTITEPFLNREFPRRRTEKLPYSENFSYFFMVL